MHRLFLMVSFLLTSTSAMAADPMLAATPSRNQLYWGVPFTIDLRIAPQEAVADLAIEAAGPPGFQIALPKNPPDSLGSGASYTAVFVITPPRSGHATTEHYRIVFNVRYRHATSSSGEPQMCESVEVPFTGTFSRGWFYFWAMVGLFVGWFIKALSSGLFDRWFKVSSSFSGTQQSSTATSNAHAAAETLKPAFSGTQQSSTATSAEAESFAQRDKAGRGVRILSAFLSSPTREIVTSVLTTLATGFLVLLLLSRHELPTGAIHDSLALGIGIGILSDDQLLNRLNSLTKMRG